MKKHYEIQKILNKEFIFKLDLNPISNEYEPHTWIRHTVEVNEAITAYLNISSISFNAKHNRYEAYSETDKLHIWFNYIKNDKNKIQIITAFRV